jgi:hypothetical protein
VNEFEILMMFCRNIVEIILGIRSEGILLFRSFGWVGLGDVSAEFKRISCREMYRGFNDKVLFL